jgi:predicted PolB exonuclease-like 3'-5' exonuclease
LVDTLPEPEVALGSLKDPEKISAKIAEAKAKQVLGMGLSPFTGRICSAAYAGKYHGYKSIDEISDAAEIDLINSVLEKFVTTQTETPHVITWNGFEFDMRFLFIRAMLLKIQLPSGCLGLSQFTKKYSRFPHTDLAKEFSGWGQKIYKLDHIAGWLLGKKKADHDFSKFIELINTGKSSEIGIYNLVDAELTLEIYEKAAPYLF